MRKATRNHPCVFNDPFIREQVDPRVQEIWKETFGKPAPFGRLRLSWREQHCMTLNPYSSDDCPYRKSDCALSFLSAVMATTAMARDESGAVGYFRKLVKSSALIRADDKPLSRETFPSTLVRHEERPGDAGAAPPGDGEGRGLYRAPGRLVSIRDLLGDIDTRPREVAAPDGEEG